MRITPDAGSPWKLRTWFEEHEFDLMMDEARARAGCVSNEERGAVDVEAVLEKGYEITPDFVELPDGTLGRTLFEPGGRIHVQVRRALAEAAESDQVSRRRLRSTLAHECAHVVQHGHLCLVDNSTGSFLEEGNQRSPAVLCRAQTVDRPKGIGKVGYSGQWWEYQANRGMASLLLPRASTVRHVREVLGRLGFADMGAAVRARATEGIVRSIMEEFDVGMSLAVYRLQAMKILPVDPTQESLVLEGQNS